MVPGAPVSHLRVNSLTPSKTPCKTWVTFWCLDDVNPRALKALTVKKTTCAPRRCVFPLGPPRYCRTLQGSMQVSTLPSPIMYIHPSRKDRWRKMDRLVSWHFILSELVSTQQRYNMWHNLLRAYDVSSTVLSISIWSPLNLATLEVDNVLLLQMRLKTWSLAQEPTANQWWNWNSNQDHFTPEANGLIFLLDCLPEQNYCLNRTFFYWRGWVGLKQLSLIQNDIGTHRMTECWKWMFLGFNCFNSSLF